MEVVIGIMDINGGDSNLYPSLGTLRTLLRGDLLVPQMICGGYCTSSIDHSRQCRIDEDGLGLYAPV